MIEKSFYKLLTPYGSLGIKNNNVRFFEIILVEQFFFFMNTDKKEK